MTHDRWPFDPNTPHDPDTWPCHCLECRNTRARKAAKSMRRSRRDMDRWMVDPQHLRDRKR